MTDRFDDDALRDRFTELREHDLRQAPAFDETLARALARRRTPDRTSLRIAAAAATVVLALGLRWIATRPRTSAAPTPGAANVPALSQWRSPTAFLLEGPSDQLLRTVPTITATPPELRQLQRAGAHLDGGQS